MRLELCELCRQSWNEEARVCVVDDPANAVVCGLESIICQARAIRAKHLLARTAALASRRLTRGQARADKLQGPELPSVHWSLLGPHADSVCAAIRLSQTPPSFGLTARGWSATLFFSAGPSDLPAFFTDSQQQAPASRPRKCGGVLLTVVIRGTQVRRSIIISSHPGVRRFMRRLQSGGCQVQHSTIKACLKDGVKGHLRTIGHPTDWSSLEPAMHLIFRYSPKRPSLRASMLL